MFFEILRIPPGIAADPFDTGSSLCHLPASSTGGAEGSCSNRRPASWQPCSSRLQSGIRSADPLLEFHLAAQAFRRKDILADSGSRRVPTPAFDFVGRSHIVALNSRTRREARPRPLTNRFFTVTAHCLGLPGCAFATPAAADTSNVVR